jgi:8-oxo-dGTP pyrophosphatase MutT (NUDIX family)
MDEKQLTWTEEERKQVFKCGVFSVWESYCKPPARENGKQGVFSIIEAKDWAIVVPVVESAHGEGKQFVMVRQWRHGARCLSLEFPGGVFEEGENPKDAAIRELREETGYIPQKIEKIGEFSPNPAIMSNKVHFFLAEKLTNCGKQSLDEDEYVEVVLVNAEDVIQGMGKEPYIHALMGSALALYNKSFNN